MTHQIAYSSQAREDLRAIREYIRQQSRSSRIATNFVRGIYAACQSLQHFPQRGTARDGHGYRVIGYRERVSIHFTVKESLVLILVITFAGWDWQTPTAPDDEREPE